MKGAQAVFPPDLMNKLKITKRIISFAVCAAMSTVLMANYPVSSGRIRCVSAAKTLAEIQAEREERKQQIAALQVQLDSLSNDKANEEAYQQALYEQITLIRENINSLSAEVDSINQDIEDTQVNIQSLELSIKNKEDNINKKIADFKERLYSMYVSGNDNLAAVLLGSSSFYDTITNIEMVNRIAEYDEQLIDQILEDIETINQSKKDLETEKLNLEMKVQNLEVKKKEKEEELGSYDEKMAKTSAILEQLALQEQMLNGDKAKYESDIAAMDAEEEAIKAEIQRKAEEAQRIYEEKQRQLAAEKAAAEAAAAAAAAAANNNSYTPSTDYSSQDYVVPAPSASGFLWPAPGYSYISSPYGWRWNRMHNGIDIGDAGIGGGAAVATKAGTVIAVYNSCQDDFPKSYSCGCNGGYGNYVVISHDGTYSSVYAHLRYATVSVGQYVEAGQQVGVIGCTGHSTGDHLHFEIKVNGVAQNPMNYVSR